MITRWIVLSALASGLVLAADDAPAPAHGLSLYGPPQDLKYKPDEPYRYANPTAPKGGTLRLSGYSSPYTKLNPFTMAGVSAPLISTLVFESLMDRSDDDAEAFAQYGLLAERVTLAPDRLWLIYHLNPKAKFSDGQPLTADDVVFSWNLIFDPAMPPFFRQYYADVEKCEKLDERTVKFHFRKYNQELPLIMGELRILPRHIYGTPGANFGKDFDDRLPVGSGPYTVSSYKLGEEIAFKRNPNYWGRDLAVNRGRHNFDVIYYRSYLDDVGNKDAIKSGQTDGMWVSRARDWVLEYNAQKLTSIELNHLRKWTYPNNNVSGMNGFLFNTRRPMFQDIRVRKALASVFDFEQLNKDSFYSQYQRQICYFDVNQEMRSRGPAEGQVKEILLKLQAKHNTKDAIQVPKDAIQRGPYVPGVDPQDRMLPIAERLQAAAQYLDSLGWKYDAAKQTRVKDGVALTIEFPLANKEMDYLVNPYLENLRKLGVKADYRVMQVAEYVKKVENFDFDMIYGIWGQSLSPGNEQRDFWTTAAAGDQGSQNYCGIKNPAIDEAVESLIAAHSRQELVTWIQVLDRLLCANHYAVPGWNSAVNRILYWQRFGHPAYTPSRSGFDVVLNWWWYEAAKAQRLDAAIAAKTPLPDAGD